MITGETVTVLVYQVTGRDSLNNEVRSWHEEAVVDGVLVAPSSTTDLAGSVRPDGDSLTIALHFPRTYTVSLRGRRVQVRGRVYAVQGDPVAYTAASTPTAWDRPVTATLVEG